VIAAPPAVVPNCVTRVAAPSRLMIACGDGNFYLTGLRWRHWGEAASTASGTAHANDCNPYCAAGHFHAYAVVATLSGLRSCDGRRAYTRLVVRYPGRTRPGVRSPEVVDLGCRVR
jgi:hypothetical protein